MTGTDLHLEDDEIVVTLPFTRYMVTYYKSADPPQLLESASRTKTIATLV